MRILLITPPFTQLNTPYPATAYLKAYLEASGHTAFQADLGIRLFHRLYARSYLEKAFDSAAAIIENVDTHIHLRRMTALRNEYLDATGVALDYLMGRGEEWTQAICYGKILPAGHRFEAAADEGFDIEKAFGRFGLADTARYAVTLTIEEIADLLHWTSRGRFGFSRYAAALAHSPPDFDSLYEALTSPPLAIEKEMHSILDELMDECNPDFIGFTVPFPGNLFAALSCAGHIRSTRKIPCIIGGGYVNTELRDLTDPRFFEYCDYLVFDDGELPLLRIMENRELLRTKVCIREKGKDTVRNIAMDSTENPRQNDLPAPDYTDLDLTEYLPILDTPSPMHRLWNEQIWIKYTLAHGCYWHKCSFCDTTLDYICRFEPKKPEKIVDDIEAMTAATGKRGIHFVDEAAPPGLLKKVCLEILRRDIHITWWTNIRFEAGFTPGLASLMAAAGCVGVAGGIETAHPRVLNIINKGIQLEVLTGVLNNFNNAGILCHGYLMYGLPSQTLQETIESLEAVRQLFSHNLLSSAYWHRFSLTAHSGIAHHPADYGIEITGPPFRGFARNALTYRNGSEGTPGWIDTGLAASCRAYMQGEGLETPIDEWFEEKVPVPEIPEDFIEEIISRHRNESPTECTELLWNEPPPEKEYRGESIVYMFNTREQMAEIEVPGNLEAIVDQITIDTPKGIPLALSDIPDAPQFLTSDTRGALLELGLMEF